MKRPLHGDLQTIAAEERKILGYILLGAIIAAAFPLGSPMVRDLLDDLGLFTLPTSNALVWGVLVGICSAIFNEVVNNIRF